MAKKQTSTQQSGPYTSINQIIAANEKRGHHFFDRDTLRGFGSRICPEIYQGRYFITSERDRGVSTSYGFMQAWGGERRYTVRRANDDGSIDTVGEFGQFPTKGQAATFARKLQ